MSAERPLLITGGIVLTADGPADLDVLVAGGVIAGLGGDLDAADAAVVDAAGCWVGPGLVDLHSHLREPGQEHKEDIASGSEAAAAGGYTAVVAMPNTDPPVDAGHLARFVVDRGRQVGLVDVAAAGTISAGRAGERLAHLDDLWDAGVRLFTDDGDTVADAGLLRRAMEYVAEIGGVIAQHAIDPGLSRGGHMHEGPLSSRLGMQGIPSLAESVVVARDLALVRLTGCRYHLQHVSTAGSLALVEAAKADSLPVTVEVTPHHLTFDDAAVATMDPVYKMMPPLRPEADVAAMRQALRSGLIDAVATDHAPHAAHDKEVPFEEAPNGVTGLEWAAAAVLTAVTLDMVAFFAALSTRPAAIAGLGDHGRPLAVGGPAHLTVVDPQQRWTPTHTRSRGANSPWLGRPLTGRVRLTVHGGVTTYVAEPLAVS
ncbi:MAG: dihydroorotase [Acidimicrobiia bacterium]|nr:dihydroorotase [Acidimicrobiia bacterium]